VYLSIFGVLGLILFLAAPIFIFELGQLSQNIPQYFEKLNPILKDVGIGVAQNFEDFSAQLISQLQESSDSIVRALFAFFGGIASTVFIFTFAFFISLEENGPERVLALLAPKKYEEYVITLFQRAQLKVSGWFGARVLACLLVGVASFVVFFLFDVKYAFILGLISGVLNFIPYVGPTITLIVAVLFVGVSNSWIIAIYIFVALLVIQEIENKFLTPVLMKKFMDMPPALVLISLLIGHTIFGFLGMIFIVPIFGIIYEFTKEFL
jgi:predicted PurR-regulated permease PerM